MTQTRQLHWLDGWEVAYVGLVDAALDDVQGVPSLEQNLWSAIELLLVAFHNACAMGSA